MQTKLKKSDQTDQKCSPNHSEMTDFYVLRASIPRIQRCEYCLEELLMYLTEKQHLGSVGGPVFVKGKIELVFFLYMYIIKNKSNENLACQHLNLQALWRLNASRHWHHI